MNDTSLNTGGKRWHHQTPLRLLGVAVVTIGCLAGSSSGAPSFPPPWGWNTDDGTTVSVHFPLAWEWRADPASEVPEADPGGWYSGSTVAKDGDIIRLGGPGDANAWGVSGVNKTGTITFEVDNAFVQENVKSLWMEFKFWGGDFAPTLTVPAGSTFTGGTPEWKDGDSLWDTWVVNWTITPQPAKETITFNLSTGAGGGHQWLRGVYISSHCTPAPGSAALLGLAGLLLRRR